MICPRCSFDNHDFAIDCSRCGVVFSKLNASPQPPPPVDRPLAAIVLEPVVVRKPIGPYEYKLLAFGVIGALIALMFWPSRAALGALTTLFHESGHALVAWLLGHPSLPAFDFMFGGGLTHYGSFHLSLALAIAAAMGYLGWRLRKNHVALAVIAAVFVIWLIFVTKAWRRETAMASAGQIFELVLAATFLYMSLTGVGWRAPEIERPLGALIAFFALFSSWNFSFKLMRDADFLATYKEGKGGALMNDLEVIALNLKIYLGINATIQGLAKLLFLFSFLAFGVAIWMAVKRERIEAAIESLVTEAS